MIKALLLDLAGVLYDGDTGIPGAVAAISALRQRPVSLRFVTNTSQRSPAEVLQGLRRLGFELAEDELYTAPAAMVAYLRSRQQTCYALVHPSLDELFEPFASPTPDAVVVADAGERFDYARLNRAFRYLMAGAELIAIGENRYFRREEQLMLDAGPFIHALAYAAGKQPVLIGKPSATFYRVVVDSTGCAPHEALMIGDDVEADVEGALRAGLQACLVQTGKYRAGDEQRCGLPGLTVAADVAAALERLLPAG